MQTAKAALTLVELLAALAIVLVLASVAYSGGMRLRESGREAKCAAQLRLWSEALGLYVADHDGNLPRRGQGVRPLEQINRPDDWFNALPPYLDRPSYSSLVAAGRPPKPGDDSLFVCPSARDGHKPHFLTYGMNMYLSPWNRPEPHRIAQIPRPAQLAFLADGPVGWSSTVPSAADYSVCARHAGRANILFVDGHIASFSAEELGCGVGNKTKPDLRWETETSGVNQTAIP